jgi:hypothetical protein
MSKKRHNTDPNTFNPDSLPARIYPEQAAKILGFGIHDIPILMKAKLLTPLGKPAPNAIKYFARVAIESHSVDAEWLGKATHALSTHWKRQNERKRGKDTARPTGSQSFST